MLYLLFSRDSFWKNLKALLENKEDYVLIGRKWLVEFDGISLKQRFFYLFLQDGCWVNFCNVIDGIVFARTLLIEFNGVSQKQRYFLFVFARWLLIDFDCITWKQRTLCTYQVKTNTTILYSFFFVMASLQNKDLFTCLRKMVVDRK